MASPDPVRILHVTDPHLFADPGGSLRGTVTYASLSAVISDILRRGWPADFIAMTGDLIQDDSAEAYERLLELVTPLRLPVHCVPGNHDVRPLMRQALGDPLFHYCESVQIGNWLITGIDTCIDGDPGGRVGDDEMQRLCKVLETATADHVAICMHHPPLPMQSRWLDRVGLYNAEEFLQVVTAAGNVRTAIFGHVHQPFDKVHDSVRIIGTPSTCAQFKPLAADFRLDDTPPAYRHIVLHVDGTIETELIWLQKDE